MASAAACIDRRSRPVDSHCRCNTLVAEVVLDYGQGIPAWISQLAQVCLRSWVRREAQ